MIHTRQREYEKETVPERSLLTQIIWGAPKNVCMCDTNTDMQTGKSAGMYTIGVTWGFRDRSELVENCADII